MTREEAKLVVQEKLLDYHFYLMVKGGIIKKTSSLLEEDSIAAAILFHDLYKEMPPHIKEFFYNFAVLRFTPKEMFIMKNIDQKVYERQYEDLIDYLIEELDLLNYKLVEETEEDNDE